MLHRLSHICASAAFLFVLSTAVTAQNRSNPACLPSGIHSTNMVTPSVTVRQQLSKLKARCRRGKLVDRRGKEIRFYRLAGCWGNPPADYLEILEGQRRELEELKKKYTVIELTCQPAGVDLRRVS
jgi:hypothetical protein